MRSWTVQYVTWLTLPFVALLASLLMPRATVSSDDLDPQSAVRVARDTKLRRTLGEFSPASAPENESALFHWNRPGVRIELEINPSLWNAIEQARNRRSFKGRAFPAKMRLGDSPPRPVMVGVRGTGSLNAPGKPNLRVNFLSSELIEQDVRARGFYLMNMRHDPEQVKMMFGCSVLAELGLFPAHFQYAAVAVNGRPLGMFLLVEAPERAIRRAHPDTVGIFRRRAKGAVSTEWSGSAPAIRAQIDHLYALMKSDAPDLEEIQKCFDLEGYLRWTAFNSVVLNNDVLDEAFFFERREDRKRPGRLYFAAWDFDDIFNNTPRPRSVGDELIFSVSDVLDEAILRSPALRLRYRNVLQNLLTEWPAERLVARLEEIGSARNALDDGRDLAEQTAARERRSRKIAEYCEILRTRHSTLKALVGRAPGSASMPTGR